MFNSKSKNYDIERYVRQYSYKNLSKEIQKQLMDKKILVVGAGATGARCLDMLIRCGFGNITVFDFDIVELQNLQRQHIYKESDIGKQKSASLKEYSSLVNKDVNVEVIDGYFDEVSAKEILNTKKFDAILDGTDNFKTRYVMNKLGVKNNIPVVFQALAGGNGFVFPYIPGKACLSCFCKNDVEKKDELNAGNSGLFSPVCSISAGYAVSLLFAICKGEFIDSLYTSFDAWYPFTFKQFSVEKDPLCKVCAK